MRISLATRCAATAGALALVVAGAPAALAADSPEIVVADGVTQPVFGYADAITERIQVRSDVDTDNDGELDIVSFDIKRPAANRDGLKSPVIMDASPYYTASGRGNESENKRNNRDASGNLTQWPLHYDNYFVPRGYAVMLLDMIGTGSSTGCPTTGGEGDNASAVVAIDWLNGRRDGWHPDGTPAVADWHNGKTGMIGKSYDGTLANAAAASGVEGLATIVPIAGISSWYNYSRTDGIAHNTNYASYLSGYVSGGEPERVTACKPVRDWLDANDHDETGDYRDNTGQYADYWVERDYVKDFKNVKASVFLVHGLNDTNVKPDQFTDWWEALGKTGVDRKLWLTQTGHVDPFDFRRAEWVDTLHRWFDSELFDIDNGILDEDMVDVEVGPDVWDTYDAWPHPDAEDVRLWFRSASDSEGSGAAGGFGYVSQKGAKQAQTFTDTRSMSRNAAMANLEAASDNKVVFMSDVLTEDVRMAGLPSVQITASTDQTNTNFGAVLVDLGTDERVNWASNGGVTTLDEEDCWGESTELDNGCYKKVVKRVHTQDREMVSQGIIDGENLYARSSATPLVPGKEYDVNFDMWADDYTFKAGHRIAIVIVGSFSGFGSVAEQNRSEITVNVNKSRITLPIVGGQAAARAAGI
jgi:X-Pro dipeptidyl-peptidase